MNKTDLLIKLLPTNLQAKTRAVFGFIAIAVSFAAVLFADNPQVALAVQALITLGLLGRQADGTVGPVRAEDEATPGLAVDVVPVPLDETSGHLDELDGDEDLG